MEKANFGQIVSFLFGIANDCLVDTYDVGDYPGWERRLEKSSGGYDRLER